MRIVCHQRAITPINKTNTTIAGGSKVFRVSSKRRVVDDMYMLGCMRNGTCRLSVAPRASSRRLWSRTATRIIVSQFHQQIPGCGLLAESTFQELGLHITYCERFFRLKIKTENLKNQQRGATRPGIERKKCTTVSINEFRAKRDRVETSSRKIALLRLTDARIYQLQDVQGNL